MSAHLHLAEHQSEAATIAELTAKAVAGHIHTACDVDFVVKPDGTFVSLEALRSHPVRTGARVKLDTIPALLTYLRDQRYKENKPVVFADRGKLTFTAFLDYHQPAAPSWLDHAVFVALELSKEYSTWMNSAGKWMTQAAMAEFLDENLTDISSPPQAEVLSFVERLEATRKEVFKSAINQVTGESSFTYSKENEGNQTIKIVSDFKLGIPFFHRGEPIEVPAKLQHAIREVDGKGSLSFRFKVQHPERIKDTLWNEMLICLRAELAAMSPAVPLFEGAPPEKPTPVRF